MDMDSQDSASSFPFLHMDDPFSTEELDARTDKDSQCQAGMDKPYSSDHRDEDSEKLRENELLAILEKCTERANFPTFDYLCGVRVGVEIPERVLPLQQQPPPAQDKKAFRNRPLTDNKVVFDKNAWDDINWDEEQISVAKEKVTKNSSTLVDQEVKLSLEDEAAKHWNKFYGIHQNKFFKNRRWLFQEFPDLKSPFPRNREYTEELIAKRKAERFPGENSAFRILEVGCGNGSTVFPLLELNNDAETYVYCCDFSSSAVEIVKSNSALDKLRCTPFVWDITQESPDLGLPFPPNSIDVITLIFVLSAISPDKFGAAIRNLYQILKPGGRLLFRDYGLHDLVQLRIPEGRCISENFYFRGDHTRVYFFREEEVEDLFVAHYFQKAELFSDKRLQVNRLKQLKMYRIWVQGKFLKSN